MLFPITNSGLKKDRCHYNIKLLESGFSDKGKSEFGFEKVAVDEEFQLAVLELGHALCDSEAKTVAFCGAVA